MARTSSKVDNALLAPVRLTALARASSLMWLSTSLTDALAILKKGKGCVALVLPLTAVSSPAIEPPVLE